MTPGNEPKLPISPIQVQVAVSVARIAEADYIGITTDTNTVFCAHTNTIMLKPEHARNLAEAISFAIKQVETQKLDAARGTLPPPKPDRLDPSNN